MVSIVTNTAQLDVQQEQVVQEQAEEDKIGVNQLNQTKVNEILAKHRPVLSSDTFDVFDEVAQVRFRMIFV